MSPPIAISSETPLSSSNSGSSSASITINSKKMCSYGGGTITCAASPTSCSMSFGSSASSSSGSISIGHKFSSASYKLKPSSNTTIFDSFAFDNNNPSTKASYNLHAIQTLFDLDKLCDLSGATCNVAMAISPQVNNTNFAYQLNQSAPTGGTFQTSFVSNIVYNDECMNDSDDDFDSSDSLTCPVLPIVPAPYKQPAAVATTSYDSNSDFDNLDCGEMSQFALFKDDIDNQIDNETEYLQAISLSNTNLTQMQPLAHMDAGLMYADELTFSLEYAPPASHTPTRSVSYKTIETLPKVPVKQEHLSPIKIINTTQYATAKPVKSLSHHLITSTTTTTATTASKSTKAVVAAPAPPNKDQILYKNCYIKKVNVTPTGNVGGDSRTIVKLSSATTASTSTISSVVCSKKPLSQSKTPAPTKTEINLKQPPPQLKSTRQTATITTTTNSGAKSHQSQQHLIESENCVSPCINPEQIFPYKLTLRKIKCEQQSATSDSDEEIDVVSVNQSAFGDTFEPSRSQSVKAAPTDRSSLLARYLKTPIDPSKVANESRAQKYASPMYTGCEMNVNCKKFDLASEVNSTLVRTKTEPSDAAFIRVNEVAIKQSPKHIHYSAINIKTEPKAFKSHTTLNINTNTNTNDKPFATAFNANFEPKKAMGVNNKTNLSCENLASRNMKIDGNSMMTASGHNKYIKTSVGERKRGSSSNKQTATTTPSTTNMNQANKGPTNAASKVTATLPVTNAFQAASKETLHKRALKKTMASLSPYIVNGHHQYGMRGGSEESSANDSQFEDEDELDSLSSTGDSESSEWSSQEGYSSGSDYATEKQIKFDDDEHAHFADLMMGMSEEQMLSSISKLSGGDPSSVTLNEINNKILFGDCDVKPIISNHHHFNMNNNNISASINNNNNNNINNLLDDVSNNMNMNSSGCSSNMNNASEFYGENNCDMALLNFNFNPNHHQHHASVGGNCNSTTRDISLNSGGTNGCASSSASTSSSTSSYSSCGGGGGASGSNKRNRVFATGYASENPAEKRAFHILSERQRRNDLKKLFETLRTNIPYLSDKQKASKLTILKAAVEHLEEVSNRQMKLNSIYEKEKQRHLQLLQNLKLLQSNQLK